MTASNSNVGAPASGAMPRVHRPFNRGNTMKKHSVHARLAAVVLVGLPLSGCGERRAAEQAVRETLKDPDSAKFGEFYYNKSNRAACLTVNAKNSMGGYTGDKQVLLSKGERGWEYLSEMDESPADCRKYFADETRSFNEIQAALDNESY
jgi:hypothetical protein